MEFDEWVEREKLKATTAFFTVNSISEGQHKIQQEMSRIDLLELALFEGINNQLKSLRENYKKCIEARKNLKKEYDDERAKNTV